MKSNKSNGQLTAQINIGDHKKSGFDLSNNVLGTGKIGRIIPTRALHVMPGDTIKADSKVAVQFEPLAVPILANMDVKQEHFYIPYNVVWKNWDKFISGGEKLDYNGSVPNTTISNMFRQLYTFFGLDTISLSGATETIGEQTRDIFRFKFGIEVYNTLKSALDTVGDTFQIKDLLQPQYKVLELLRQHFDDTSFVSTGDFSVYYHQNATQEYTKEQRYQSYLDLFGLSGNKYMEELKPMIIADSLDKDLILPTDRGFAYLSLLYEFIKPFIGLGSNIDYLNMGRLTLTEFIAMYVMHLSLRYKPVREQPIAQVTLDVMNMYNEASKSPLSILNLRANYNVWYNNYRDILLEANAFEPYDGDDITIDELFVLLVPRQRCWEKDAFTTALDNPGTGNVGVPITRNQDYGNEMSVTNLNSISSDDSVAILGKINDLSIAEIEFEGEKWCIPTAYLSGQNKIEGDVIPVQGFSLHALDAAQRAQKWLQKALYFGNRISDFYYMRFGVRFLDARLRLPELLTSSSELVKLDVIMNNTNITTEANGEVFRSIAGDRAAYASAYDNGNSFDRFCEEHGVIMSYLTVMPQITYAYGINRDYSRLDQFDFAFAEFATLGMDAVYDTEITASSLGGTIDGFKSKVFGYQGRYYDYKSKHSEEHGELLDSQDMYTFSRKYNMFDPEGRPKLNYEFVHCFPSLDMFVVDDPLADYFRYDIRHSTAAERELPSQSIYI